MRKSTIITLILILSVFQSVSAEEKIKVAVLDATIGNGVEANASAIVADTINEQFVKSKEYIAIDRAYISKIQAEKKFQLSGEVNSSDVKELGALFGAQFICIANVSKLGSTYTVSARMIDVATAQVVSQESARQKGQIDILFEIAETVGNKLVGKNYTVSKPAADQVPEEKKVIREKPVKSVINEKQSPRKRMTFGYMMTSYIGGSGNEDNIYDLHFDGELYADNSNIGFDTELLIPVNNLYFSLGLAYTLQNQETTFSDNTSADGTNFYTMEIYGGLGWIYPKRNYQLFAGLTIGYFYLELGDYWAQYGFEGENAAGVSYGFEVGADYYLGRFSISIKYKLAYSGAISGDKIFTDDAVDENGFDPSFGTSGLVLSVGLPW